ncbi:hypothetical protein ACIGW8_38790 [Streptomyces sioyaensis]|uniref:hypothetical protein n=1 Tax=Streptomyces sioyaensis TaxID=67364 RepID=UPI0037CDD1A9
MTAMEIELNDELQDLFDLNVKTTSLRRITATNDTGQPTEVIAGCPTLDDPTCVFICHTHNQRCH